AIWDIIDSTGVDESSYLDTGLTANTTYDYRVLAFNSAGASSYSNIDSAETGTLTSVMPKINQQEMIAFPNPAQQVFNLNNSISEEIQEIILFDILGKQIRSFEENSAYSVDGINNGVYWLMITTQHQHYKQKLMIQ